MVLGGSILVLGSVTHYRISKSVENGFLVDFHSVLYFRTSEALDLKL